MKQLFQKTILLAALLVAASGIQSAMAMPILGGQLTYTGGSVTVESLPVSSGFTSELGLYNSAFVRLAFLLFDEPPGVVVNFVPSSLGIAAGAELIFGIRVVSDNNREYFTGPGSRNPDGIAHAKVNALGGGIFDVGFEDLFGGGDLDFDDNVFRFTGGVQSSIPEPVTFVLLTLGLAGLGFKRKRV